MTLDLKLPLASLRPVRIRELKESALCLSYDKRGTHIFFDRFQDSSKAVLLNGDHAFHSFEVEAVHNWKGLAVTDYRLVVDVGSAIDTENQLAPLGAISLGSKGVELSVLTKDYHGFPEKVGLQLGIETAAISPSLQASFTRWAFEIGDVDRPQFLWFEADLNEND